MFIYEFIIVINVVYIRLKNVKGKEYAYLVENVWDKVNKQPRQINIKYLGRVDKLSIDLIPEEYRNDQKLLEFISRYKLHGNEGTSNVISNSNKAIVDMLSSGNIDGLLNIFNKLFVNNNITNAIVKFYERLLIPALQEIDELWMHNRLGIAVEHVCSNTANSLIKNITYNTNKSLKDRSKGLIIIVTPSGELHNIACNIFESILVSKGYRVLNLSPSIPRDVIIKYVKDKEPDALLISVTLPDNINAVEKLIKALRKDYNNELPIIIGGKAVSKINDVKDLKCIIITNEPLIKVISIIDEEVTRYNTSKNN